MFNETSAASDPLTALKRHFNYDSFRPGQEAIVRRLLAGEDLFVIMPTSAGKSLCFQLPILMKPSYGLVICPLIALMKDQIDKLNAKGIPAVFVNSLQTERQQAQALSDAAAGRVKFIYIAPERLCSSSFLDFIERYRPSMLIVDEAHAISQFGHGFRPAFLKIGDAMKRLPGIQICAFTATATPMARQEIRQSLYRPSMRIVSSGFERPNLAFKTISCRTDIDKSLALRELLVDGKPAIIYVTARAKAQSLGEELGCRYYHAELRDTERQEIEEAFLGGSCNLLVSTCAFGMGIDRPDVRRVVHFNVPGSLEAYFQEAGRAGRDGKPAECVLLHAPQDYVVQRRMIESMNPTRDFVERLYDELVSLCRKQGNNDLKLTNNELIGKLPWAASEAQVGAALSILETYGWIFRSNATQAPGIMTFLKPANEMLDEVKARKSEAQMRLVGALLGKFGSQLENGVQCSYDFMAACSALEVEKIKKAIHKLSGKLIAWTPPSYRRVISVFIAGRTRLKRIDWRAIYARKEQAMNRLNSMFDYISASGCRQGFILDYFGEDQQGYRCGVCDRCKGDGAGHGS